MSRQAELEKAFQLGVDAERSRCIEVIEGRAAHHNGPRILTLELNQLASVIRSGLTWLKWSKSQ